MAVGQRITRNTLWNAAGRLWDALAALVLTRYIIEVVGTDGYGLWGMVAVCIGYAALADVGLASAYVKFVAGYAARQDTRGLSRLLSTGIAFYVAAGGAVAAVGWCGAPWFVGLFERYGGMAAANAAEMTFLLRGALLLFAATNVLSAFPALLSGLQRMDLTNLLSFAASWVKIIATVAFLKTGFGLPGLLYSQALAFGVFAGGAVMLAFRLVPGLRIGPGQVRRSAFAELFGFGWRTQLARLANLIMFETDLVVAYFISGALGLTGMYKLGVELANKMRQLPNLLVSALVPAASELDAQGDEDRLARLYLTATKYVAAVALPLALFFACGAGLLMRAWMGAGHETAAWVLRILSLGYIANILPGAGISVVLGRGRAGLQMQAGVISSGANVLLTVALALTIGFWGIPIATAVSMVISWAWFARAAAPVTGASAGCMLRVCVLWPTLAALLPAALLAGLDAWLARCAAGMGSLSSLAAAVAAAAVYFPLYALLLQRSPFLSAFDYGFLGETLGLARLPLVGRWLAGARRA